MDFDTLLTLSLLLNSKILNEIVISVYFGFVAAVNLSWTETVEKEAI